MNKPRQARPLNPQIRTEAIEWLLRFSEAEIDAAAREKFNDWLRTSPEHVRAYLRIAAFWQEAGHIDGNKGARDIGALIARAKVESNVFPLAFNSHPAESAPTRPQFLARRSFFAIAATFLIAIGALGVHQHLTRDIYETRVGEQRTINLPDGSTVTLNAQSRVAVRYSATYRTIELDEGQALFKVAKNPSRPFIVRSGDANVRAVGTQFDVYRKTTGTTVTVVEGKVAVSSEKLKRAGGSPLDASGVSAAVEAGVADRTSRAPAVDDPSQFLASKTETAGPVFLVAGEQVTIPEIKLARTDIPNSHDAVPRVRSVKAEQAIAWTEGLLIFDGASLADVIGEFNRQNKQRLVLHDPALADLKISGTFPVSGSERIVRFLQERFGVVVHENDDDILLSRQ